MLTHYIRIGGKIKQFFMCGIITPLLWDGQKTSAPEILEKKHEKVTITKTIKLHGDSKNLGPFFSGWPKMMYDI